VVCGEWLPKYHDILAALGIENLAINYARGFTGANIDFLNHVLTIKGLEILVHHIPDCSPINSLHELRDLIIDVRPSTDVVYSNFPFLENCGLDWHHGASSIFACNLLHSLRISTYPGSDFSEFAHFQILHSLSLSSARTTSFREIGCLPNLRTLGLHHIKNLSSLEGIEAARNIESLDITSTKNLRSIEAISSLHKLKKISFTNCGEIKSLAFLAELIDLESVTFYDSTVISDGNLAVLLGLPKLTNVRFKNRKHYTHKQEDFPYWVWELGSTNPSYIQMPDGSCKVF
jgi:hypothetical protein